MQAGPAQMALIAVPLAISPVPVDKSDRMVEDPAEDADVRLALRYIRAHRSELLLSAEIDPQALVKAAAEVAEMTLVPEALALRLIEDELDAPPSRRTSGTVDTKTAPDLDPTKR